MTAALSADQRGLFYIMKNKKTVLAVF